MRAITKAEFARERGVSRTRVYQWLESKRIAELEDGRIDADDAHAKLNANLDQAKGIRREGNVTSTGPAPSAAGGASGDLLQGELEKREEPASSGSSGRDDSSYWESRSRREKAEAQLAEMKAMQAAGALVPAAGVRKEAAAIARQLRNAMLAIPDRVSPVLDPANPARAHKLLTDEIAKVLREFGAGLEQRVAADSGAPEREEAVLPGVR